MSKLSLKNHTKCIPNKGTCLPAEDPEGPDVRLGGEASVVEDLWGRPLDGELGAAVGRVLVVDDVAGQPEVRHLRNNGSQ